jgi:hypothetical protein
MAHMPFKIWQLPHTAVTLAIVVVQSASSCLTTLIGRSGAFAADVPSRKGVLDSSLDQRVFIGRR